MFNIAVSSHTDIGDVKQTNQDSVLVKTGNVGDHKVGMFIVADGCGGMSYGDEISNLVVTHFSRVWGNELNNLLMNSKVNKSDIEELLERAITDINMGAINFSKQVSSKVGSTLSLLLTIDNRYFIKNIGDSRIYLKRGKTIRQITEDQSLVADMIRNGEITREESKTFKKKNVLTMCIGIFDDIKIYSNNGKVKNRDTFIVCCDGLHNQVSENSMLNIINNKRIPFEEKPIEMRNCIEAGKASDNVSSVMINYKKVINHKKIFSTLCIAVVIVLIVYIFRNPVISIYRKHFQFVIKEFLSKVLGI